MKSKLWTLGMLLVLSAVIVSGCGPTGTRPSGSPTVAPAPTEVSTTPVSSTLTEATQYELTVAASTPTPSIGVEYCRDWKSETRMSYEEAAEIARKSECVEEGQLKQTHMCNEFTGTWWIDLDIDKPGCNPACVIQVVDKTTEINWRCTGLVPKETVEQPTEVSTPTLTNVPTATPTEVPTVTPTKVAVEMREPAVTIWPTSGPSGILVKVIASGFPSNTPVSVGVAPQNSQFSEAARGTTDANGSFTVDVAAQGAPGMALVFAVAAEGQRGVRSPDLFRITE